MLKHTFSFTIIVIMILVVSPTIVLAQLDPIITEEIINDEWLEYTVINPNPSTVGDIVGFLIEVHPDQPPFEGFFLTGSPDGWADKSFITDSTSEWEQLMFQSNWPNGNIFFPLTWREFFGGIDYPFGDAPAAGFFLPFTETNPGIMAFNDPTLAISPGEQLGDFRASVPMGSPYVLAYINDAENDTFDDTGLANLQGEAVPEPGTLLLLGLGGLGLIRKC